MEQPANFLSGNFRVGGDWGLNAEMSDERRILGAMNWRRGVLLAAIHFVMAVLVVTRIELSYWPAIRSERVRVPVVVPPSATAAELMEADFFPCDEGGIIDRAAPPRRTSGRSSQHARSVGRRLA
jgi:hypothetical protein